MSTNSRTVSPATHPPAVTSRSGRALPDLTRLLLLGGVTGPILFVAVTLADGATRPGYDAMRQYVSLLTLGDGGWVETVNFIVSGILIAAFGVGLRRTTGSRARRWMSALVVVAGLAFVWSGLFSTDPEQGYPAGAPPGLPPSQSLPATLHYLGSVVGFVSLAIACALSARRGIGSGVPASTGWAVYSLIGGAIVLGGWLAGFFIIGAWGVAPAAGLLQRITIVAGMQWLFVTALLELRRSSRPPPAGPAG
jgi:hypothetical protein